MKAMTQAEMKQANGGIVYAVFGLGGAALGINIRIAWEHARYGRCYTYKRFCKKCR